MSQAPCQNETAAEFHSAPGLSPSLSASLPASRLADSEIAAIQRDIAQASFVWDVASDTQAWSSNVSQVLHDVAPASLKTGYEFSRLIGHSLGERLKSIASACGSADDGCYRIEYGLHAAAGTPLWIEESGLCINGPDGKPASIRGAVRVINERRAREEALLRLAERDPLTGELNRAQLLAALGQTLEEALRFRSSFAFLIFGIDHLARVNDAFGFAIADELIRKVAHRIQARLRGGDTLGRFSGNKFGLILRNCSPGEMRVAAERFLAAIRDDVVLTASGPVSATVSIGGLAVPRFARTLDDILNRTQEALQIAKDRHAGSLYVWSPDEERDAQRRANIRVTEEIVAALNERRLTIAFEPVVEASTGKVRFYECLVRMKQNDGRLALAPDIVPVAERLGLIRLVDHRVFHLVVSELRASPGIQLSLNISPDTTLDSDWWTTVETMLSSCPDVAQRLIVEITETVAIQDLDKVRDLVARLKALGCRIAIDDFGAGFTSFRNLRKLGVDIVKIDGAFVQNIMNSPDDQAFVQTLIDLARRLGILTVAEWVQDESSAALLRGWGCDFIQGRLTGLASLERSWRTEPWETAGQQNKRVLAV